MMPVLKWLAVLMGFLVLVDTVTLWIFVKLFITVDSWVIALSVHVCVLTGDSRLRSRCAACDWSSLCLPARVCSQMAAERSSVQARLGPVQNRAWHTGQHWQDQEPVAERWCSQWSPAAGWSVCSVVCSTVLLWCFQLYWSLV